jgi:PLD-like domain
MVRKGREHSHRDGMGNDRLHGVRVSGESAQQDQHDGGRPGFLHDLAVFPRIVPVSHTIGQALLGGTFHPKRYLFEIADRFGCVMGSSNFTRGGFGDNAELNICIEGKESDAFFRQVEVFIEEQEKHSDPITAPEIAARKWAESGLAAESEAMESAGCIRKVFQTRSRGDRSGEFQDRETSRYCRPG